METLNKTINTKITYVTPKVVEINIDPAETILQASRGEGNGDDFGFGGED